MPDHTQTLFMTRGGIITQVDEGMYDILTELKRLGVETQYSCEGEAYFVGTRKSVMPLLRKMRKISKRGWVYSKETQEFVEKFFEYGCEYHFDWHYNSLNVIRIVKKRYRSRQKIEKLFSNKFGFRVVLRWPEEKNYTMLHLLRETRARDER